MEISSLLLKETTYELNITMEEKSDVDKHANVTENVVFSQYSTIYSLLQDQKLEFRKQYSWHVFHSKWIT